MAVVVTPLRASVGSFQNFHIHYRHIEDVHGVSIE